MEQIAEFAPAGAGLGYVLLDVFTRRPLEGNPLAVFTGAAPDAALMQRIARELNLSESVFLSEPDAGGDLRVRIFTPSAELPFAGHPVLGTAVLAGLAQERDQVVLETGAGAVAVRLREREGSARFGAMAQPLPSCEPWPHPAELLAALGVGSAVLPIEVYDNGPRHTFVALGSEAEVTALAPDLGALAEFGAVGFSCFAADGTRVRSRAFAPGLGVNEDPATGSAAGPLALHLARHGRVAWGEQVEITQGVEIGRPSTLLATASGSDERLEQVEVAGWAVIAGAGELHV
jgi:trans-2,3-dihydro-3-hydroxyanthranilate isomerase